MPIDLATVCGADDDAAKEFNIPGVGVFRFGPLAMAHYARMDFTLRRLAKTPIEEVAAILPLLPAEERAEVWAKAKAAAATWEPPRLGSYEGNRMAMDHPEASYELFRVMIQAHNPGVENGTIEEAWRRIDRGAFLTITMVAMEAFDPKALLAAAELTPEVRTSLQEQCRLDDLLSPMRAPFRWLRESSPSSSGSGAASPPASLPA